MHSEQAFVDRRSIRVALLASCTAEMLQEPLAEELSKHGFEAKFWASGFDQFRQAVLSPGSGLYEFEPEIVILYVDGADVFADVMRNPLAIRDSAPIGPERAMEIAELAETLSSRLPHSTILLNTIVLPPLHALSGLEYNSSYSFYRLTNGYNETLSERARKRPANVIVDVASMVLCMGYERWVDRRLWLLARIRWSRGAILALAERYAVTIASRLGRTRKCIVLDLDNTLWGGVVGEVDQAGIQLGSEGPGLAFAEFQRELLQFGRKGILLAICSKNNLADALKVIREHPSMELREQDFAAMRINWEDKATNIREIAEELNIGLDSIVFVDDNPVERAWIRQELPEVMVPEWPANADEYQTAILQLGVRVFCKLSLTPEDTQRAAAYLQQNERRKLRQSAASVEEFYRSLKMCVAIGRAGSSTARRIAELTQKTNQFNLTTRRYSELEIMDLAHSKDSAVFWLALEDCFGPSGLVGVLILRAESAVECRIDTFLLSCRVMGRTVERAFLGAITEYLKSHCVQRLIGEYIPTPKNAPARRAYAEMGFTFQSHRDGSDVWELDVRNTPVRVPDWFQLNMEEETVPR